MQKPFLNVVSADEACRLLSLFRSGPVERVGLDDALFRVLAAPVAGPEDTPTFTRSTMDGFAVRAADTFGASESAPALLRLVGEVAMGEIPERDLAPGEAVRIWTGGALPGNADAVVMVEHTELPDEHTVEALKAVAPFDNTVRRGEDFKAGETLLKPGHRLRPQDIGLLAAMGITEISAYQRPTIGLLSSGDEIVPVDQTPPPGCMRDVNRHALFAMVREAHAHPLWIGIAPDVFVPLETMLKNALERSDCVVISGGSSMGSRDLVIDVLEGLEDSEILLHGVSISPGKPLIAARVGNKPALGLPGHPVSAMITFEQFVVPLIRRLEGEDAATPFLRPSLSVVMARNVASREGRTDYVRVRLEKRNDRIVAVPVPGKSGMVSTMVRAHGFIRIGADCEGVYKDEPVIVHLFADWIGEDIEKEYLSRHEISPGSPGDFSGAFRQERLSRL